MNKFLRWRILIQAGWLLPVLFATKLLHPEWETWLDRVQLVVTFVLLIGLATMWRHSDAQGPYSRGQPR